MRRYLLLTLLAFSLMSCYFNYETHSYSKYYDDENWKRFQSALDWFNKKDYQRATLLLDTVIKQSDGKLNNQMPLEINPHLYRGHGHYRIGKNQLSVEDLSKVIADTTTDLSVFIELADNYRMLSNPQKALYNCNVVLKKLNPSDPLALYVRGLTHLSLKDTSAACADFTQSKTNGFNPLAFEEYNVICNL